MSVVLGTQKAAHVRVEKDPAPQNKKSSYPQTNIKRGLAFGSLILAALGTLFYLNRKENSLPPLVINPPPETPSFFQKFGSNSMRFLNQRVLLPLGRMCPTNIFWFDQVLPVSGVASVALRYGPLRNNPRIPVPRALADGLFITTLLMSPLDYFLNPFQGRIFRPGHSFFLTRTLPLSIAHIVVECIRNRGHFFIPVERSSAQSVPL